MHVLFDGDPDERRLTGENVDPVLWLLLGLELDSDASVLSVLLLFVVRPAAPYAFVAGAFECSAAVSPSLESSDESPVNGLDRIWLALCSETNREGNDTRADGKSNVLDDIARKRLRN